MKKNKRNIQWWMTVEINDILENANEENSVFKPITKKDLNKLSNVQFTRLKHLMHLYQDGSDDNDYLYQTLIDFNFIKSVDSETEQEQQERFTREFKEKEESLKRYAQENNRIQQYSEFSNNIKNTLTFRQWLELEYDKECNKIDAEFEALIK